jgi:REP element-mobilizing transposase RayT
MERYRIVEGVAVYFVTFAVVDWLPVFVSEEPCKVVTESLNFCVTNKSLRVSSYVIMPTHVHLIVFDAEFDAERLKRTLVDLRKFTGRELADYCAIHLPACFAETLKRRAGDDRERRFWQPTQHPVGIVSEQVWKQKMDYLHINPCRKGLVRSPEDWRFSSASIWLKTREPNDVQLAEAVW